MRCEAPPRGMPQRPPLRSQALHWRWRLGLEEASVVAPFFQAAPLFGYVLSYGVLGERLTLGQDFGGLMIIGGTALLSVRADKPRMMMKLRLIALMLTCALSMSVASLIFKIFAIADEFWTATFWSFVGQVGFGAGLLASAAARKQLGNLIRSGAGRVLGISGVNEAVNLMGTLGARYALLLAPLSLVQAVASTTSLFVFLFGVILSIVRRRGSVDEESDPENRLRDPCRHWSDLHQSIRSSREAK
jgi:hypothetical protein